MDASISSGYCSMWRQAKNAKISTAVNTRKPTVVVDVKSLPVEALGYESPLSPEAYQQLLANLSNSIVEGAVVKSPRELVHGISLTPEQAVQFQEQEGMANALHAMLRAR